MALAAASAWLKACQPDPCCALEGHTHETSHAPYGPEHSPPLSIPSLFTCRAPFAAPASAAWPGGRGRGQPPAAPAWAPGPPPRTPRAALRQQPPVRRRGHLSHSALLRPHRPPAPHRLARLHLPPRLIPPARKPTARTRAGSAQLGQAQLAHSVSVRCLHRSAAQSNETIAMRVQRNRIEAVAASREPGSVPAVT
jgi:hypothetical protein